MAPASNGPASGIGSKGKPSLASKHASSHTFFSMKGINMADGLMMLESGDFADAKVVCGQKTWKVHKIVVCTRSVWFKRALAGGFIEEELGRVVITNFEEEDVDFLLTYLYCGDVEILKEWSYIATCVQLATIGDYFLLPDLEDLAVRKLVGYLKPLIPDDAILKHNATLGYYRSLNLCGPTEMSAAEKHEALKAEDFLFELDAALRLAYEGPNAVRCILSDFLYLGQKDFFQMERIQRLLQEVPELSAHIMLAMTRGLKPSPLLEMGCQALRFMTLKECPVNADIDDDADNDADDDADDDTYNDAGDDADDDTDDSL